MDKEGKIDNAKHVVDRGKEFPGFTNERWDDIGPLAVVKEGRKHTLLSIQKLKKGGNQIIAHDFNVGSGKISNGRIVQEFRENLKGIPGTDWEFQGGAAYYSPDKSELHIPIRGGLRAHSSETTTEFISLPLKSHLPKEKITTRKGSGSIPNGPSAPGAAKGISNSELDWARAEKSKEPVSYLDVQGPNNNAIPRIVYELPDYTPVVANDPTLLDLAGARYSPGRTKILAWNRFDGLGIFVRGAQKWEKIKWDDFDSSRSSLRAAFKASTHTKKIKKGRVIGLSSFPTDNPSPIFVGENELLLPLIHYPKSYAHRALYRLGMDPQGNFLALQKVFEEGDSIPRLNGRWKLYSVALSPDQDLLYTIQHVGGRLKVVEFPYKKESATLGVGRVIETLPKGFKWPGVNWQFQGDSRYNEDETAVLFTVDILKNWGKVKTEALSVPLREKKGGSSRTGSPSNTFGKNPYSSGGTIGRDIVMFSLLFGDSTATISFVTLMVIFFASWIISAFLPLSDGRSDLKTKTELIDKTLPVETFGLGDIGEKAFESTKRRIHVLEYSQEGEAVYRNLFRKAREKGRTDRFVFVGNLPKSARMFSDLSITAVPAAEGLNERGWVDVGAAVNYTLRKNPVAFDGLSLYAVSAEWDESTPILVNGEKIPVSHFSVDVYFIDLMRQLVARVSVFHDLRSVLQHLRQTLTLAKQSA